MNDSNKKYPRGKLSDSDEGALAIEIKVKDKTVVIDFGKDISWIGMDKTMALQLAMSIISKAQSI